MWRTILSAFKGPDVPARLRADYTVMTAHHMRGQARLLFCGFLISLPIIVYAASPGVGAPISYGIPLVVLLASTMALYSLRRPIEGPTAGLDAPVVIDRVWMLCLMVAALGSIWAIASWAGSPLATRIYYPSLMALGALIMSYSLTAVRSVGMSVLVVTLGPVTLVLLAFGQTMDRILAVAMLIAMGFQMVMMARHRELLLNLVEERHRSAELARTDPLTGLSNRLSLIERFAKFVEREESVRLMVVDIDRFKTINDSFGHDVGDQVLEAFAALLKPHVRGEIFAARLGGEEFGLIGPTSALDPAVALQLLTEIAVAPMPHGQRLTASIGVAEAVVSGPEAWNLLYARADRALYRAKNDGRNRVVSTPRSDAAQAGQAARETIAQPAPRQQALRGS